MEIPCLIAASSKIMTTFKKVFIDIVNYCNAKCPFCITGLNHLNKTPRKHLKAEDLELAVKKLLSCRLIDEQTDIGFFIWGEPALHPDLQSLVEVLNLNDLKYSLSTNASVPILFNKVKAKNLNRIIFSMPGFSQKSYSKIHGFKFDKIKANIQSMINNLDELDYQRFRMIYFHVYQFNLSELQPCAEFANSLNIYFKPYYAFLNKWEEMYELVNGTLPYEKLKEVSENLFSFELKEILARAPSDYKCPQFDLLIIDEQLNVLPCCQLPTGTKEFSSGNLLTDDISEIMKKRVSHELCTRCRKCGLAYYINNSLVKPEFYKG